MILPAPTHENWKKLLNGELDVSLKNFFLQMKVTQAKSLIEKGNITIESAIDELHDLCNKFKKAKNMEDDLIGIFGEEALKEPIVTLNELNFSLPKKSDNFNNNQDLLDKLKYEREILFYKNKTELSERMLQEKESLITTLQEEILYLRKKNELLYEGIIKIENVKAEHTIEKQDNKKGWSFFNFRKNK
jgi:predicted RNase H-like nuclease (RuvC/YqgF family)